MIGPLTSMTSGGLQPPGGFDAPSSLQPADRAYLEVELGFRLPPKEGGAPALRYATRDDRIARGLRAFALWRRCAEDSQDYLAAWRGSREDDST